MTPGDKQRNAFQRIQRRNRRILSRSNVPGRFCEYRTIMPAISEISRKSRNANSDNDFPEFPSLMALVIFVACISTMPFLVVWLCACCKDGGTSLSKWKKKKTVTAEKMTKGVKKTTSPFGKKTTKEADGEEVVEKPTSANDSDKDIEEAKSAGSNPKSPKSPSSPAVKTKKTVVEAKTSKEVEEKKEAATEPVTSGKYGQLSETFPTKLPGGSEAAATSPVDDEKTAAPFSAITEIHIAKSKTIKPTKMRSPKAPAASAMATLKVPKKVTASPKSPKPPKPTKEPKATDQTQLNKATQLKVPAGTQLTKITPATQLMKTAIPTKTKFMKTTMPAPTKKVPPSPKRPVKKFVPAGPYISLIPDSDAEVTANPVPMKKVGRHAYKTLAMADSKVFNK